MKRIVQSAALLLILSLTAVIFISFAEEKPVSDDIVYVAGNPSMAPVEYYDTDEKEYKGIMPDIYKRISEDTGINFVYISPGEKNNQQRLAKNRQIDMVSAHIEDSIAAVSEEYPVLSFTKEEKEYTVCIGFTPNISKGTAEIIKNNINALKDEEMLGMAVAEGMKIHSSSGVWVKTAAAVLSMVILILITYILHNRAVSRRRREMEMVDFLTGIGNFEYYVYCFSNFVSSYVVSLYFVAYISVDSGKIEKYMGLPVSEEVQCYAADVLAKACNDADFTARITDGVFAYVFQCTGKEDAERRVQDILSKLNRFDKKVSDEYRIVFRAGIYKVMKDVKDSETALEYARQGYMNAVQRKCEYFFSDERMIKQETTKIRLQRKMLDAINNNEFQIFLQFIVDIKSGCVIGAEALSRWQNPEEGLLTPKAYIDALNKSEIIDKLDLCILEQVCQLLEKWNDTEKRNLFISCNFTRVTISRNDFAERFINIIDRYDFNRANLIIELTEDTLSDNEAGAYNNVMLCKNEGFKIALDDLGTGYTCFSDLQDYPVDIVKIDRELVAKASTDKGKILLKGISYIAHELGIKVLHEGIEKEEEVEESVRTDCDYIQGFYFSRVLPLDTAEDFLNKSEYYGKCINAL